MFCGDETTLECCNIVVLKHRPRMAQCAAVSNGAVAATFCFWPSDYNWWQMFCVATVNERFTVSLSLTHRN